MNVTELTEHLERHLKVHRHLGERTLCIKVLRPGAIGGTPVVGVASVHPGIDWDSKKLILTPEQDLTVLSREEVDAIRAHAREMASFAMYQVHREHDRVVKDMQLKIDNLRSQRDQLRAHLERVTGTSPTDIGEGT